MGQGISIPGDGTNVPNTTNDTDFGTIQPGGSITKTYTLQNLGDKNPDGGAIYIGPADLVLTDSSPYITITGADAADFSLAMIPVSPVLAQESTTFQITFSANSEGVKNAVVTIKNNDFDETNFSFNIQASSLLQGAEIEVTGNGLPVIGNGSNIPDTDDDTDFGAVVQGSNLIKTFTINNPGNNDLLLTDPSPYIKISGVDASDFSISAIPAATVLSQESTSFDITFRSNSVGVKNATVTINNNDLDESGFTFNIRASSLVSGPDMVVTGQGTTIQGDGSNIPIAGNNTDFGSVLSGGNVVKRFTINNSGNLDLLFLDPIPYINISGTNSGDFVITAIPADLVLPGGSTDFDVTFNAGSPGIKTAVIGISSNDPDLPDYNFNISAESEDGVTPVDPMITMTTTTGTPAWRLGRVTNSGDLLKWQAENNLISISVTENNPTFNFSANDGGLINITISSTDNFIGLKELDLRNVASSDQSKITAIDISKAVYLTTFSANLSSLMSIDVTQNTALQRLFIIGNRQIPDQALNTSANTELTYLRIDGSGINSVDLSNNTLLTTVQLNNARLTSDVLDQLLIDLDNHGNYDGQLQIRGQPVRREYNPFFINCI